MDDFAAESDESKASEIGSKMFSSSSFGKNTESRDKKTKMS